MSNLVYLLENHLLPFIYNKFYHKNKVFFNFDLPHIVPFPLLKLQNTKNKTKFQSITHFPPITTPYSSPQNP